MFKNLRSLFIVFSLAIMLLSGIMSPSAAFARGQKTETISVQMMQKAASILFGEIPDNTVETAFEFVEVVQNDSRQRQKAFTQLGEFFIEVGQSENIHRAAADFVREQPILSEWYEEHDGDGQTILSLDIIIIFLVIGLIITATPAY